MRLWLKFDSSNPATNSAGPPNTIRIHGRPGRMPHERGIYKNWGAFFDFGDCLEITGGLDHKGNRDPDQPHLEWSIVFWTILPSEYPIMSKTNHTRTLV